MALCHVTRFNSRWKMFFTHVRRGRVKQGAKDADFACQVGVNYTWLTHGASYYLPTRPSIWGVTSALTHSNNIQCILALPTMCVSSQPFYHWFPMGVMAATLRRSTWGNFDIIDVYGNVTFVSIALVRVWCVARLQSWTPLRQAFAIMDAATPSVCNYVVS